MSADSTTVTRRSDLPIQHTTRYTQLSAAPFKNFWR
jgi:hypothetical protein